MVRGKSLGGILNRPGLLGQDGDGRSVEKSTKSGTTVCCLSVLVERDNFPRYDGLKDRGSSPSSSGRGQEENSENFETGRILHESLPLTSCTLLRSKVDST